MGRYCGKVDPRVSRRLCSSKYCLQNLCAMFPVRSQFFVIRRFSKVFDAAVMEQTMCFRAELNSQLEKLSIQLPSLKEEAD
jgi:hypothetical protein